MKKIFSRIVTVIVATIMLLSLPMDSLAAGEMAYNLYTGPDMSKTSGVHKTFIIDFRAPESTYGTYWALANFGMDLTKETQKVFKKIKLGGGYAGLQHYKGEGCETDRVGILSFWHWEYFGKDENGKSAWVELNASQMWPDRNDNPFGGEGTGMQSIHDYAWEPNQWYTMALHTWEDVENNSTFAGLWFLDQTTGKWSLCTYYDTHLINSGWTGDMGLFMENFMSSRREGNRSFNVKGMYVLDKADNQWKSINKATVSYGNGGNPNKVGTHEYGATEEYFWGLSNGTMRDDQAEHDSAWPAKKTFTINQPDTPTFAQPVIDTLSVNKGADGVTVSWAMGEKSSPQLGYTIEIIDEEGNTVSKKNATRPEEVSAVLSDVKAEEFNCRLTITDLFGQTVVKEQATDNYQLKAEQPSPSPEVSEDEESTPAEESKGAEESKPAVSEKEDDASEASKGEPSDKQDESGLSTGAIIGIVIGVIAAVAAVAVVAVLVLKKKK